MRKRKRLGIIYRYNENWTGGNYYIENLVKSLNVLDDSEKPMIYVFSENKSDFLALKNAVGYPHLRYWPYIISNFFWRAINRITRSLAGRNWIDNRPRDGQLDLLFPNPFETFFDQLRGEIKVNWIPDFQEKYFPEFFSEQEILHRTNEHKRVSESATIVIFSSEDAQKDFERLYPLSVCTKYVLKFAVTHDLSFMDMDSDKLLRKYGLPSDFFISPNQFWVHKNHQLVVRAISEIKKGKRGVTMVFTGRENDYRSPNYTTEIKNLVEQLDLGDAVKFLGFIPRNDLLKLMQLSIAVVQPSLFEGWSTVVEDAKALNKFILASDIPVHREQLEGYADRVFFDPRSGIDLSQKIIETGNGKRNYASTSYDYKNDISDYARNIVKLLNHRI
jgi:glycosyltransferase involved in cell wall biosynthesis